MYNPFEVILNELKEIRETLGAFPTSSPTSVEIIDRPELMKRLNISEPTAIRWGKIGRIPELRFGTNVRYDWSKVVASLNKNSRK
jgi:hypothetical protein